MARGRGYVSIRRDDFHIQTSRNLKKILENVQVFKWVPFDFDSMYIFDSIYLFFSLYFGKKFYSPSARISSISRSAGLCFDFSFEIFVPEGWYRSDVFQRFPHWLIPARSHEHAGYFKIYQQLEVCDCDKIKESWYSFHWNLEIWCRNNPGKSSPLEHVSKYNGNNQISILPTEFSKCFVCVWTRCSYPIPVYYNELNLMPGVKKFQ